MKKTLLLLVALLAGLSAWAQNAKLIRCGQLVQSFYGSSALAEAISAAEDEGDVHLRVRVREIFRDAAIVLKAGERELLRRRVPVLLPSEMQDITVKRSMLADAGGDITAAIEEVRA